MAALRALAGADYRHFLLLPRVTHFVAVGVAVDVGVDVRVAVAIGVGVDDVVVRGPMSEWALANASDLVMSHGSLSLVCSGESDQQSAPAKPLP